MKSVNRRILEQVIAETAEPVIIVRVDHTKWPVALCNRAFEAIGGGETVSVECAACRKGEE